MLAHTGVTLADGLGGEEEVPWLEGGVNSGTVGGHDDETDGGGEG